MAPRQAGAGAGLDPEAAVLHPASVFGEPGDVLAHDDLSFDQKLRILLAWEQDAMRLLESEGEGMQGGEESRLGRVREALAELRARGR